MADKASRQVAPDESIRLQGPPPRFVSRGGEKLDAALEHFGIDPAGRIVLDAGASTGGFSDCLLQRGAAEVVAVDVGYGQLHERVAADPRVRVIDRTNIRHLEPAAVGAEVDMVTADLSFISLRKVAEVLLGVCRPGADLVMLVKPQFEAGRQEASRGKGIISDPEVWRRVLAEVIAAFAERGAIIMGVMVSPITGSDGNVEFLLHVARGDVAASVTGSSGSAGSAGPAATDALIDAVVAQASAGRER